MKIESTNVNKDYRLNVGSTMAELQYFDSSAGIQQDLSIRDTAIIISRVNGSDGFFMRINDSDGIHFSDNRNDFGCKYAADYSAAGLLNDLWIPSLGGVKKIAPITVGEFNSQGGSAELANISAYQKFYVKDARTVSTIRLMATGVDTANLLSVKLYDSAGNEITDADGSVTPGVLAGIQTIDITLTSATALSANSFHWIVTGKHTI